MGLSSEGVRLHDARGSCTVTTGPRRRGAGTRGFVCEVGGRVVCGLRGCSWARDRAQLQRQGVQWGMVRRDMRQVILAVRHRA